MIISHVKLSNWRNFQRVDVPLRRRIFLVGPNACGKSNFLDVFRFLRDIAKPGGGLQQAVKDRGGISKIRCLAARQEPDIDIEIDLAQDVDQSPLWKYAIRIKQEPRGNRQPYLAYEKVWKQDVLILNRPDDLDKKDFLRTTQTHLEQISANQDFREIYDFLKTIIYLHLIPQLVRHPDAFTGGHLGDDPFGRTFLERVAKTPKITRSKRLGRIEEALTKAIPQLKKLAQIKDETGIPHLEAVYEHWRPNDAGKQREDQFSDGTLRLIGLFWSLLEGKSPLLLEEPELSLHAAIVKELPAIIYRLQKTNKRQVILSTHSADLLSDKSIGGEEVLLMTPSKDGTEVYAASDDRQIKDLLQSGFDVGEAVLPRTVPQNTEQLRFTFMNE